MIDLDAMTHREENDMTELKLNMKESLEGMSFSTRLTNALISMAGWPDTRDWNLDDVLATYRMDPGEFRSYFLRMPNAGRVSLNEFLRWADDHADDGDYAGRVTMVRIGEAVAMRRALTEVCNSVDQRSEHYRHLRKLQHMLDSSILHIQRPNDPRLMFSRGLYT